MFRVVGRDARGNTLQVSVCAATKVEARAVARGAGVVLIDAVSNPPPARPSRFPKLSGFVVGVLGCLGCLGITSLGAVIGWFIGDEAEPPGNFIRIGWLVGSLVGATLGLVCGVSLLVAGLRRIWDRR